MQGLFVDGRRPKSKKEVKDLVAAGEVGRVSVEATSFFGDEYDGPLSGAPTTGRGFTCVGPDPRTSRKFYLTLKFGPKGWKVT